MTFQINVHTDLYLHLNKLNVKFQGVNEKAIVIFYSIKAFVLKYKFAILTLFATPTNIFQI